MAGDGVSMPQTIAQMGNVAKTQAKGQQQTQATTPFQEQKDRAEDLKVQRVQETEGAEHRKIEGDDDPRDKRRRRRQRRNRKLLAQEQEERAEAAEESPENEEESVGGLVDLHA